MPVYLAKIGESISDGSADMKKEKMGTGFAVGMDRTPLLELASQVGGPLATLRAEPAGLFYLPVIWRVRQYKTNSVARNPSDC